jgi:hypothetical protein
MDAEYTRALETRLRWLRWAKREGKKVWGDIQSTRTDLREYHKDWIDALPAYESSLQSGDTFCMTKDFCHLVEYARKTVPDDLIFDHTWMQSKQGWLWIETPFKVPLPDGATEQERKYLDNAAHVAAVGWSQVPVGMMLGNGRISTEDSYYFLCFQDLGRFEKDGFACWSYFAFSDGDRLIDRVRQFEHSQKNSAGAYGMDRSTDMMHEIRWIYAAFHLMAQRLATSASHPAPRPTRRRMEREQSPVAPVVRVVTLRRLEQERQRDSLQRLTSPNTVDWQFQWIVRDHGRWQWYPSQEEHRFIWVDSYVKGPEDKPLKNPSHKLFIARR